MDADAFKFILKAIAKAVEQANKTGLGNLQLLELKKCVDKLAK